MALETLFQVNEPTTQKHFPTLSYALDFVDYEQIPIFGTFILVDQLLSSPHLNLKHIKFSAKLLNGDIQASFFIHPPISIKPQIFIESMIKHAMGMCQWNDDALNLKHAAYSLQSSNNSEKFTYFTHHWVAFTKNFLNKKIHIALSQG